MPVNSFERKTIIKTVALLIGLLILPCSYANDEITPEQIEGATRVSAEDLISLAETMPDLVIIDARISKDRIYGYIEGSISLPNTRTNCDSLAEIVKKSGQPALYYCNGPKCGRSVKSIEIALQCGYTNIYWYRDGFEDWKLKNYPFITDTR